MKKDEHGALVQAYIDRDGIQYKHTHLDLGKYDSPPHHQSSGGGHVEGRPQPPNHDRRSQQPAVAAMEVQDAHRKDKSPRNKIGGFFSRLASFRFSNRKGQEEKAKLKKRQGAANVAGRLIDERPDCVHTWISRMMDTCCAAVCFGSMTVRWWWMLEQFFDAVPRL